MKIYIWHNTRGSADQYFVCVGDKVLFQIPNFIGRSIERMSQKKLEWRRTNDDG